MTGPQKVSKSTTTQASHRLPGLEETPRGHSTITCNSPAPMVGRTDKQARELYVPWRVTQPSKGGVLVAMWINLEDAQLSDTSQSQNGKCCVTPLT